MKKGTIKDLTTNDKEGDNLLKYAFTFKTKQQGIDFIKEGEKTHNQRLELVEVK